MNVLVDTERLRSLETGLGQMCLWLGRELARSRPADSGLAFLVPPSRAGIFGADVSYRHAAWWRTIWSGGGAGLDVWHVTHQDSPFRPAGGSRQLLTILDLNFLERADYSPSRKARRLASLQRKLDRASAISTISHHTASVVRAHLTVPDVPLRVIYLGNPLESSGPNPDRPGTHPVLGLLPANARFFLFVGVLQPKKNVHTLVPVMRAFPDRYLVLAGPAEHAYAATLRETIRAAGLQDRILIAGRVADETKRWLYEGCEALLFPSISEGFGLPVVEAMSCGKPVFLSRLTSLPEIGGDDARYFDSFDPEDMAETVRAGLRAWAADAGAAGRSRARAARFTWRHTAAEYWSLYEQLGRGV